MKLPPSHLSQLVPQRLVATIRRVEQSLWQHSSPLAIEVGPVHEKAVSYAQAKGESRALLEPHQPLVAAQDGQWWSQRWAWAQVPQASHAGERFLCWDADGEAQVWIDGSIWAGLDPRHQHCRLPSDACQLAIDIGSYMTDVWIPHQREAPPEGCRFRGASIAVRDADAHALLFDLRTMQELLLAELADADIKPGGPFGLAPAHDRLSVLGRTLLWRLDRCIDIWETDGIAAARKTTAAVLAELAGASHTGTTTICGHGHLDMVWLWPADVTDRKAVHTASNVLHLMEQYPEFRFTQSQLAWYRSVADLAPDVHQRIHERIQEGRWEATGGMDVEADVLLPCGEALLRNMVDGQETLLALTGSANETLWLPDAFGYSACIPQIMRMAGLKYFYTTKLAWSSINEFPHTSFRWQSADGSEVIAHAPAGGYNGTVTIKELREIHQANRQAGITPSLLHAVGHGDGGGGPTEEMLERARRLADLSACPRVSWGSSQDVFVQLAQRRSDLPVVDGELYLEGHRGTATTQSDMKLWYRRSERMVLAEETVRALMQAPAVPRSIWQQLFVAQFHDTLPGTCIGEVYTSVIPALRALVQERQSVIHELLNTGTDTTTAVLNSLALPWRGLLELPVGQPSSAALQQSTDSGTSLVPVTLPAASVQSLDAVLDSPAPVQCHDLGFSNGHLQVQWNEAGHLTSLIRDGVDLGLRQAGCMLYPDYPASFEAWEVDRCDRSLGQWLTAAEVPQLCEIGPLRARVKVPLRMDGPSQLVLEYILEAGADHLRVEVHGDWQADDRLLRFECVTDHRGRHARYGQPFGSILREQVSGSPNTAAQWEVCGQRWAAVLDDQQRGLALLSEAKYGFDCQHGMLGVSLLRAPEWPDPQADRGQHHIRLAIAAARFQQAGSWASTAAMAEALFAEATLLSHAATRQLPWHVGDWASAVPSCCAPAKDGQGLILRVHETAGSPCQLTIEGVGSALLVDGFERPLADQSAIHQQADGSIILHLAASAVASLAIPW